MSGVLNETEREQLKLMFGVKSPLDPDLILNATAQELINAITRDIYRFVKDPVDVGFWAIRDIGKILEICPPGLQEINLDEVDYRDPDAITAEQRKQFLELAEKIRQILNEWMNRIREEAEIEARYLVFPRSHGPQYAMLMRMDDMRGKIFGAVPEPPKEMDSREWIQSLRLTPDKLELLKKFFNTEDSLTQEKFLGVKGILNGAQVNWVQKLDAKILATTGLSEGTLRELEALLDKIDKKIQTFPESAQKWRETDGAAMPKEAHKCVYLKQLKARLLSELSVLNIQNLISTGNYGSVVERFVQTQKVDDLNNFVYAFRNFLGKTPELPRKYLDSGDHSTLFRESVYDGSEVCRLTREVDLFVKTHAAEFESRAALVKTLGDQRHQYLWGSGETKRLEDGGAGAGGPGL